jgi:protoporphyrinogen oxidase
MIEAHRMRDVVVIGGGLGGLAAATMLARQGRTVTLLEKASTLGGRAATQVHDGYSWNLGPHALYRGGRALQVLAALGVTPRGGIPSTSGNFALYRGKKHMLPAGFFSLVSTGLLGLAAKVEIAKLLAAIGRIDVRPLAGVSIGAWIDSVAKQPEARALLHALVRVSTYAHAPDVQSAGAAIAQLQMAADKNVLYADGGGAPWWKECARRRSRRASRSSLAHAPSRSSAATAKARGAYGSTAIGCWTRVRW